MNCTKVFYAFPMSTANLHSSRFSASEATQVELQGKLFHVICYAL